MALIAATTGNLAAQADSADPQRPSADPQRTAQPARQDRPPADPEIVIPFTVGADGCPGRARTYTVTMRIYNVLAQPVGIPRLARADSASASPAAAGRPLSRLALPCGRYTAHWNGRHMATGQRLAPGVYLYDLVVDGHRVTRKVTLGR